MPDLITGFALVAVVLVVAGLTPGFVARAARRLKLKEISKLPPGTGSGRS